MRTHMLAVGLVLLVLVSPAVADDKPDLAHARTALDASRELTRMIGEGKTVEGVRAHVNAEAMLEATFGAAFTSMDDPARVEAAEVLRLVVESVLAEALATDPPVRKSHHEASLPKKGRVTVRVTIPGRDRMPGGVPLVFEVEPAGARLVDTGALVSALRARYAQGPRTGLWDALVFLHRQADPKALAARVPASVLTRALPAPNPLWLRPDVLLSRVAVPTLSTVSADTSAGEKNGAPWLVVTIGPAGDIGFRPPPGTRGHAAAFSLASDDVGVQDDAIQALIDALAAATKSPALRTAEGRSRCRGVVFADAGVKCRYVHWVMRALADPRVRVSRLALAVRRSQTAGASPVAAKGEVSRFGLIDVPLPLDPPFVEPAPPTIRVKLFRREMLSPDKAYTLLKLDNDKATLSLPRAWRGRARETEERIEAYDKRIRSLKLRINNKLRVYKAGDGDIANVHTRIVAPPPKGGAVPFGDVARVIDVFRDLGFGAATFKVVPAPLTVRERAARNAKRKR